MLKIYDNLNPEIPYEFRLSNIIFDSSWIFSLESLQLPDFKIDFNIPISQPSFHDNYSTSVYLLKNKYFAQKDVIEIRVREPINGNGRIGYIIQLNSIFDPSIISINKHLFSFIYYGLGNIFYNDDFKQTKDPTFEKTTFELSDFFDEDILVLIVCDQIVAQLPNFDISEYLPSLYKYGFYWQDQTINTQYYNITPKIQDNFNLLSDSKNQFNYYSLKLDKISVKINNDDYINALFKKQLLLKLDNETRFIILYQIIEILITKILTIEININICNTHSPINSTDLKYFLVDISKEAKRISLLLSNKYTNIDIDNSNELKYIIYTLLNKIRVPKYLSPFDATKVIFHETFYDYRNELLHNHRLFKSGTTDEFIISNQMALINSSTELLIVDILNTYNQ